MDNKFSISVISNACGILPHTLRVWEQRYNMFNPERTNTGKRLYSAADLEKAKLLAQLQEQGHSISSLANYTNSELKEMVELLNPEKVESPNFESTINIKKLIKYILEFKLDLVAVELQHLRLSTGTQDFILKIVLPLMRETGTLVAKGKFSVTQEHIMSTIIREQLAQIYLPNIGNKGMEIALATPEGNIHELSIIIADILCRSNRVTTRYFGAAHPADCLGEALNALKPKTLVLGVISSAQWDYKSDLVPYLKKIDNILTYEVHVILGGGFEIPFPKFKNIKSITVADSFEKFNEYLGSF